MRLDTRLIDHNGVPLAAYLSSVGSGAIFDITEVTGSPLVDASGNGHTLNVLKGSYVEATSDVQKWGKGILNQNSNILGIASPPAGIRNTLDMSLVARVKCDFTTQGAGTVSMAISCGVDFNAGLTEDACWAYGIYTRVVSGTQRWGYCHSGNPNGGLAQVRVTMESTEPATPGEHTITLRRTIADRRVVMKVDGVEVINSQWFNAGSNHPFVHSSNQSRPFCIGGYDSTVSASANNKRWGGSVYSVHVFDSAIDQAVLDAMATDVGADYLIGGESAFWQFQGFSSYIGGLFVVDAVTDANGDFSVDISTHEFTAISHVTPSVTLNNATHTNLLHPHLRVVSLSTLAGTVTTVAGARAGAGIPVKLLVVGRRT